MMIIIRMFVITILISYKLIMFMNSHKIVCWNCRDVLSHDTISIILHLLKKFKPMIFSVVETRADDARLTRFCSKIENRWHWASIVTNGFSG